MTTRRRFLQLSSGLLVPAAGLALPKPALSGPYVAERKFLFLYCFGGWDTTMVFSPLYDNPNIDMEPDSAAAEVNGITFVDHAARPSVREFFEDYGDRSAIVNGFEVRSVTHERCQRLVLTATSDSQGDDWASILAGNSQNDLLLPHLVLFGPAYSSAFTPQVIRVGGEGQLPELLDGSALDRSEVNVERPLETAESLGDAFVSDQVARSLDGANGQPADVLRRYQETVDQMADLAGVAEDINLLGVSTGCSRDIAADAAGAFDSFEQGLSRCAMVQYDGWCDVGWDTHQSNDIQSRHYEEFFTYLNAIFADLDSRTSASGAPLADEVTVVIFSEMGRHPQKNAWGGRDHWTYTSILLAGAGVRGGQVVGGWTADMIGEPVDLASGGVSASGTSLSTAHVGATLLALGDLDPGDWLPKNEPPISAVIS